MVKSSGNDSDANLFIKPLEDQKAFNKGVEWFVEILFFYGVLTGIAAFEANRFFQEEKLHEMRLKKYEESVVKILEKQEETDEQIKNGEEGIRFEN